MLEMRKLVTLVEEIHREGGRAEGRPLTKAVVMAVLANPYAGRHVEDLSPLVDESKDLGALMVGRLVALFGGNSQRVESYGKGAIVGAAGEVEHGYAFITTTFATPVREALGGARAWMSSAVKRGAPGVCLDVPLAYKDALYVRSHYDAIEAKVGDAPLPDEVVILLAGADGPRLHARLGGLRKEEAKGEDGLR